MFPKRTALSMTIKRGIFIFLLHFGNPHAKVTSQDLKAMHLKPFYI